MSKFNSPKLRKYLSNVHNIGGAHVQCLNNLYAKFEHYGIKSVGVTDYTNQTSCKHLLTKKISMFKTPKIEEKNF